MNQLFLTLLLLVTFSAKGQFYRIHPEVEVFAGTGYFFRYPPQPDLHTKQRGSAHVLGIKLNTHFNRFFGLSCSYGIRNHYKISSEKNKFFQLTGIFHFLQLPERGLRFYAEAGLEFRAMEDDLIPFYIGLSQALENDLFFSLRTRIPTLVDTHLSDYASRIEFGVELGFKAFIGLKVFYHPLTRNGNPFILD